MIKGRTPGAWGSSLFNFIIAFQRVLLLDSHTLEKTKPDHIEVLPGVVLELIAEVNERMNIQLFEGGFIRSIELEAGAKTVTNVKKIMLEAF
ncbi:glycerol-3-phosphate responsive antiterminator [Mesobacillus sp. AQ2]|uniref:glycerol-3-phosphate responsive antiterminator n=1 Tax=Bacillaceae TaxID=186817 RepID=UPI0021B630AE|nr:MULTISPECIES: glycerol-3-phosphate responsive antiterminator [Bacillaceae]WHX40283.1 glycerol-3-phosphate responsive antiterminator [Mesobacillus sp. AQ2]